MKTNTRLLKWGLPIGGLMASIVVCSVLAGGKSLGKYTAHEWGTFTSVQGGNGLLLEWQPLETSKLPQFVYDWRKPGLNRLPAGAIVNKGGLRTLQRMETPVIYFYSEREETVDVSVSFPQGLITEWYPQACQVGPSRMPVAPAIAKLDEFAHKAGAKPAFSLEPFFGKAPIKESRARWVNVHLLPEKENRGLADALPLDRSGSHYFAARETDAAYVRLSSLNHTNPAPEQEKFIFYRGVGNFATPLRVTMDSRDALGGGEVWASSVVTILNTGQEVISNLFLLDVQKGNGHFVRLEALAPGERRKLTMSSKEQSLPLEKLSTGLGEQMVQALVSEGLFEREAKAMVKTWSDSWFAEEGLRVLYTLPRAWTDRTLPLTLDPAPRDLVRVMVGRAEVIPPAQQQQLSESLVKADKGDLLARERVISEFKKLGRFGEPALNLATQGTPELRQTAWSLFRAAAVKPVVLSKGE